MGWMMFLVCACISQRKHANANNNNKGMLELQLKMMVNQTADMLRLLDGKWTGWQCASCKFENDQKAQHCSLCKKPVQGDKDIMNFKEFLRHKTKIQQANTAMVRFVESIVEEIESGKHDGLILTEPDDSIRVKLMTGLLW